MQDSVHTIKATLHSSRYDRSSYYSVQTVILTGEGHDEGHHGQVAKVSVRLT